MAKFEKVSVSIKPVKFSEQIKVVESAARAMPFDETLRVSGANANAVSHIATAEGAFVGFRRGGFSDDVLISEYVRLHPLQILNGLLGNFLISGVFNGRLVTAASPIRAIDRCQLHYAFHFVQVPTVVSTSVRCEKRAVEVKRRLPARNCLLSDANNFCHISNAVVELAVEFARHGHLYPTCKGGGYKRAGNGCRARAAVHYFVFHKKSLLW